MKTLAPFSVVLCILLIGSALSVGQDVAKPAHTEPIPQRAYKTWSLFLVCNPQWMAGDKSQDLNELHKAFEAFGQTIGPDNVAVWFWKHKYKVSTTLEDVDLERSSKFCRAFKLPPSKGPYIFVTSTYLDESHLPSKLPPDSAWFELGSMKPAEISELLAHLADDLVANRPPQQPAPAPSAGDNPATTSATWEVRLLGAVQHKLNSFGCAWTFKIKAEAVEATLHACST